MRSARDRTIAATLTAPMVDKTTLEPVTQRLRHINLSVSVPKESRSRAMQASLVWPHIAR
jgi:hypothetical protein